MDGNPFFGPTPGFEIALKTAIFKMGSKWVNATTMNTNNIQDWNTQSLILCPDPFTLLLHMKICDHNFQSCCKTVTAAGQVQMLLHKANLCGTTNTFRSAAAHITLLMHILHSCCITTTAIEQLFRSIK